MALAIRDRWPSVHIAGIDTPSVLTHARSSGAIDEGLASMSALGEADLVGLQEAVRVVHGRCEVRRDESVVENVHGLTKKPRLSPGLCLKG